MEAVELREVKPRVFGMFGSFTWASKAVKSISEFAERMGYSPVSEPVEMKQGFDAETAGRCFALGKSVAEAQKA